jgi:hypothetical protein
LTGRSAWTGGFLALVTASTVVATAQVGGTLIVGGNPTPGTSQPEPPNLGDRVTVTGCLRPAPKSAAAGETPDANVPGNARFVLANAKRVDRLPAGTGGSTLAVNANSSTYRLAGLDSQFSPFVNALVEISGEVKPPAADKPAAGARAPSLLVEFVQRTGPTCPP